MTQVWIGLSDTLDAVDLLSTYIDPVSFGVERSAFFFGEDEDDDDAETAGLLVTQFGASEIEPGGYEVYSRSDHLEEKFDYTLFLMIAPFAQDAPGLRAALGPETKSMFFVVSETPPSSVRTSMFASRM